MSSATRQHGLVYHGVMIFFLGLVVGIFVPVFANPRMGLSAHVGAVTTGTIVAVLGLAWDRAALVASRERITYATLLYGAYVVVAALVWAAATGTSRSTPIAGAGHSGSASAELIADLLLATSSLAMLVATALFLLGLRAAAAREG